MNDNRWIKAGEKSGGRITVFLKESSTVDMDAHGGPAWQHVLALWFLTYTHAFDRIPRPRLSDAVLDYYSRI